MSWTRKGPPSPTANEPIHAVRRSQSSAYFSALGIVALCTLISWPMSQVGFQVANEAMVFLLGVVFVATRHGMGPSVFASVASMIILHFVFVPVRMSFVLVDSQHAFTLAVMLASALLISHLASRVRRHADVVERRATRISALYSLSRALGDPAGIESAADAATVMQQTFGGQAALWVAEPNGSFVVLPPSSASMLSDAETLAAAKSSLATGQMERVSHSVPPGGYTVCFPLLGSQAPLGALLLHVSHTESILDDDHRELLEAFAHQITAALERRMLSVRVQAAQVEAESERLRSSLLSAVSHDLRTPLAVITGASSSLLETGDSLDAATRQRLCETIYNDATWLARLVDNLLRMVQLESGGAILHKQLHVLDEVIGSALRRVSEPLADAKIETNIPEDLPLVPLDDVLFEQVLVNLFENAQKYARAPLSIEIAARREADSVILDIADSGLGLLPGEEERVFEKFYRGPARKVGRQGVGLGLAICRAIVTAHDGTIVASNRPQGGARFTIKLPLARGPHDVADDSSRLHSPLLGGT